MKESKNVLHIENDKRYAPFLLAASFHGLIQFEGSHHDRSVLFWQFSPQDIARILIDQFKTKTEPHIPAKDIFEAIETFWQEIAEVRNGGSKYAKAQ